MTTGYKSCETLSPTFFFILIQFKETLFGPWGHFKGYKQMEIKLNGHMNCDPKGEHLNVTEERWHEAC